MKNFKKMTLFYCLLLATIGANMQGGWPNDNIQSGGDVNIGNSVIGSNVQGNLRIGNTTLSVGKTNNNSNNDNTDRRNNRRNRNRDYDNNDRKDYNDDNDNDDDDSDSWLSWFLLWWRGSANPSVIKGKGPRKTIEKEIRGVRNIDFAIGIGDLTIEQCEDPKNCEEILKIVAQQNIYQHLDIKQRGKNLSLDTKKDGSNIVPTKKIEFYARVKSIENIGAGGLAYVDATVDVASLTVKADGQAQVIVSGKADDHTLILDGSAKCDAKDLENVTSTVTMDGSSKAIVAATTQLHYELDGSSELGYVGNPRKRGTTGGSSKVYQHKKR